jgi:hypothetical protein
MDHIHLMSLIYGMKPETRESTRVKTKSSLIHHARDGEDIGEADQCFTVLANKNISAMITAAFSMLFGAFELLVES